MASSNKSYEGVSEAVLARMKQVGATQNGTVYDPPEGNRGTATTKVPLFGTIVLAFDLDPVSQVITYEIREKPGAVADSIIWSRVEKTISDCKESKR